MVITFDQVCTLSSSCCEFPQVQVLTALRSELGLVVKHSQPRSCWALQWSCTCLDGAGCLASSVSNLPPFTHSRSHPLHASTELRWQERRSSRSASSVKTCGEPTSWAVCKSCITVGQLPRGALPVACCSSPCSPTRSAPRRGSPSWRWTCCPCARSRLALALIFRSLGQAGD